MYVIIIILTILEACRNIAPLYSAALGMLEEMRPLLKNKDKTRKKILKEAGADS